MKSQPDRSVATRILERFRYGLASQEILDATARWLRILVCPYYVVAECLQSGTTSVPRSLSGYQIRPLAAADLERVRSMRVGQPVSGALEALIGSGRCLGLIGDGQIAGYTCWRADMVPVPYSTSKLFELADNEAYMFGASIAREFRGRRLAPALRRQLYVELATTGRTKLYSITLAFNRSSRRFKARLGARELELRLVLGIVNWRALDLRVRRYDSATRGPAMQLLRLPTGRVPEEKSS